MIQRNRNTPLDFLSSLFRVSSVQNDGYCYRYKVRELWKLRDESYTGIMDSWEIDNNWQVELVLD